VSKKNSGVDSPALSDISHVLHKYLILVSQLFGQHGDVASVALINDRETGRPRGFGFIEMDDEAAQSAISALDGQDFSPVRCG